tara:strand:+ start:4958 stop:5884 length:927 start_codon:yes stop_codon:yes gene_type:complete
MIAFLFPGQGSQKPGMASEFEANFQIVKDIFAEADEILKINLSKFILNGPEDELKRTDITQPAILTTSFAIFSVLKKEFNYDLSKIKYFAGHSLGEYSALVSSNSLKFEDGLKLVHLRGKFMQEAVPLGKGSMLAVMGLSIDELNHFLNKMDKKEGVCEIANDNSNSQIILSGDEKAIKKMSEILKQNQKKSIPLPVSAPFHCSLMKPAAEKLWNTLKNVKFSKPTINLVNNVNATSTNNDEEIKNLLFKQIFSQVRWRESIEFMLNNGINQFIEIGPGKVLSGLVKRISDKPITESINKIDDIKKIQ